MTKKKIIIISASVAVIAGIGIYIYRKSSKQSVSTIPSTPSTPSTAASPATSYQGKIVELVVQAYNAGQSPKSSVDWWSAAAPLLTDDTAQKVYTYLKDYHYKGNDDASKIPADIFNTFQQVINDPRYKNAGA